MENLNLCELLSGCENMKFYSTLYCDVILTVVTDKQLFFRAILTEEEDNVFSSGRYFSNTAGECTFFPSKDQRDWSKFVKPIQIDTQVMASRSLSTPDWCLRYYAGGDECWIDGFKAIDCKSKLNWKFIVPVSEFDFNDLESNKSKSIC